MLHIVTAARQALLERNWYAALALALALPDICGSIEEPDTKTSRGPYTRWCQKWLVPQYTALIGADREEHVFLTARDLYALRCAFLHQGSDEITTQSAREVLDNFEFIVSRDGWNKHMNQTEQTLQLQVDTFTLDVCAAAERWFSTRESVTSPWPMLEINDLSGQPGAAGCGLR